MLEDMKKIISILSRIYLLKMLDKYRDFFVIVAEQKRTAFYFML